jgi:hypothetical protein
MYVAVVADTVCFRIFRSCKMKIRSVFPSDLQEVVVGSAHDKYEVRTVDLFILMRITMCCVDFSCFPFYVMFLFHTRKIYIDSYGVVKNVRMRFESPFFHPVYMLLLSCWTNVTCFKISLLFAVTIMGSGISHVSFRLCHQEMDNQQGNIHLMTEPLSQTLGLPLTFFSVSISLTLGISISV